jgi:predicted transcriptional regulator
MRTTVDLPDEVFRQLKMLAVQRGTSLKELFRTAVEHELAAQGSQEQYRARFPLLASKEPGTLSLSNAEIEDLLA